MPPSELRSVEGPTQAGDYVAIIVMVAAQVKVQDGETFLIVQPLVNQRSARARRITPAAMPGW